MYTLKLRGKVFYILRFLTAFLIMVSFFAKASTQNNSLDFDGVDDFVEIPDDGKYNLRSLTIECWINPMIAQPYQAIITKYNSYLEDITWFFGIENGELILGVTEEFGIKWRAAITSGASIVLNQWQHVATSFDVDSQKFSFYIDGVAITSSLVPDRTDVITQLYDGDSPVRIGAVVISSGQLTQFWDGQMDEVRIWNVARSQSEIRGNMDCQLTGQESGLISYYKMDIANSSNGVIDSAPISTHGKRQGTSGTNNLPQYISKPSITQTVTWYYDVDMDGFGDPSLSMNACSQPNGYVMDCTDNCPEIFGKIGDVCDDMNEFTIGEFINDQCECSPSKGVPTLSQWGIIILSLCLSISGAIAKKQKIFSPRKISS